MMTLNGHVSRKAPRPGWWLTPWIVLSGVLLLGFGCKEEPTAIAPLTEGTNTNSAPSGTEPVAKAHDNYEEASFALSMRPVGEYEAGTTGKVQIVLEPKGGFKCNDEYPHKFKAKESAGIEYAAPVFKGDVMQLGKERGVMDVAFTPKGSGKKDITGTFAFSVCSEERCLIERRELALAIDVK